MPTNTDLVSQLPADFEVFGQAVDTSLADLKGGTTGQILSKNSNTDMDFVWASAAPGGKVLQVINATLTTDANTSSSTYASTGLTATITPSSASSKVLVLVNLADCGKNNNSNLGVRLYRGASSIFQLGDNIGTTNEGTYNGVGSVSCSLLDSPATTSATTYTIYINSPYNASYAFISNGGDSTITLLEIGA